MLKLLRITATIHQIPEWSRNHELTQQSAILKQFIRNPDVDGPPVTEENINRSRLYMQK